MSRKLDLAKYKRLAKYMQIVIKVFLAATIICMVISVGVSIYLALTPAASLGLLAPSRDGMSLSGGSLSLSIDNLLMFKVNPKDATAENLKPVMINLCFMAASIGAVLAIIFRQLDLILGTVKNDTPFVPENSKRLTIIGTTLIIGAFIKRIGEALAASAIINSLKLFDINVNFSPDSNMIVMGFIVLVLAGVFKYGSYLQKEFDSTV